MIDLHGVSRHYRDGDRTVPALAPLDLHIAAAQGIAYRDGMHGHGIALGLIQRVARKTTA